MSERDSEGQTRVRDSRRKGSKTIETNTHDIYLVQFTVKKVTKYSFCVLPSKSPPKIYIILNICKKICHHFYM